MGEAGEKPVYWDFKLDYRPRQRRMKMEAHRGASCWEQQGFGAYYYGTQGRGKPDDDPVIPKETGNVPTRIPGAGEWQGREIHIVFEAAMTDTDREGQRPSRGT